MGKSQHREKLGSCRRNTRPEGLASSVHAKQVLHVEQEGLSQKRRSFLGRRAAGRAGPGLDGPAAQETVSEDPSVTPTGDCGLEGATPCQSRGRRAGDGRSL